MEAEGCLAEDTIAGLAGGGLAPAVLCRAEEHLAGCSACRELVMAAFTAEASPAALKPSGPLARGTIIGRYTVLALVGRGGMGEVYAAYDGRLERKIALKLLRGASGSAKQVGHAQARLLREAKAMAKVSSSDVVRVHDAGTFEGRVFVAMEFIDGVTLKDWLVAQPRSRAEVLAAFARAGCGLQAAHLAGLVHRDFKPGNVMIGSDGAVRVMDFGLARSLAAAAEADVDSLDLQRPTRELRPAQDLTRTGDLLGTPLYMSPEQYRSAAIDARSDQFSFCVALYQALYGAAPFEGADLKSLAEGVLAGRVRAPPAGAAVPGWLRRVLLRGLSVDPGDRWPSMSALLDALADDPARARRRRLGVLGVLALAAVVAAGALSRPRRSEMVCRGGPARLAGAWGAADPTRTAVERAFRSSGAPAADALWRRVSKQLDEYAASWLAAHRDACEATHVRGEQSAALLDLRMVCLDGRRDALAALTDVLRSADRTAVARSVDAVNALPAIEGCSNAKRLSGSVEPPRDEATRARVDDIRRQLAAVKALIDTGQYPKAVGRARALLDEARATAYAPVIVEALPIFAWSRGNDSFSAEMLPVAEEAVWAAMAAGRDDLAAESAVKLVSSTGYYLDRAEASARWSRFSHALLDRVGDGHGLLLAWLLQDEALVKSRANDPAGALDLLRRANAIKEKVLGPEHPDMSLSLNAEAESLHALGRDAEALERNARALALWERAYGQASLDGAAYLFSNRGEYLLGAGRAAEAEAILQQALRRWESQLGPDSHLLGYALTALGRARLALGRPGDAVAPLSRACRLRAASEPVATLVAESRFALAQALWPSGGDRREATRLATQALETYAASAQAKERASVGAWLAAHAR